MPTLSEATSTLAIRCEGIGKRYRIGQQEQYRTLRDTIANVARAPFRQLTAALKGPSQTAREKAHLWALKDISLEIQHGEVVGIIGRNGSGKSTLLKILSQITKPTKGSAEIRGRVGTLLEVGAGFHPELTGRENIYLNGAILGMARREIDRKFDEIVEFSECSRMLDTPLKHYSSGMYVRLAFAVAAHLETEILIVDEVLAVGDAGFQKKCLGKIGDVANQGRTVLFVSHNMLAVDSLCTRAICLHDGRMVFEGTPAGVTARYLQEWLPTMDEVVYDDIRTAPGNEEIKLHRVRVRPRDGTPKSHLTVRMPLIVEFEYWKMKEHSHVDLGAEIFNEHGIMVFATGKWGEPAAPQGLLRSSFVIPANLMNSGTYRIHMLAFHRGHTLIDDWEDIVTFEVHDAGSELRGPYYEYWPGAVRPNLEWQSEFIGSIEEGTSARNGELMLTSLKRRVVRGLAAAQAHLSKDEDAGGNVKLVPPIETEHVELLFDPDFRRSVEQVQDFTCLDIVRLANLWTIVKMVGAGTFLEVGSFRGGTALHICNAMEGRDASFYSIDPFETGGFQELTESDQAWKPSDFTNTHYDAVSALLAPKPIAKVIRGLFPAAAEQLDLHNIALCQLEVDIYNATFNSLEYLLPTGAKRSDRC